MRPRRRERGAGRPPFLFPLLFAAALAAAVLTGALPALAATDQSHLSTDPAVGRAREAIRAGRLDEALEILRPLSPRRPDGADILFLRGLAALKASQRPGTGSEEEEALLGEAIGAFRTILFYRPGFVRVRLELARAHFLKGEDTAARRHFEPVLAGRPAPIVVANVQRFLRIMRARRRWQARSGLAVAPDSNINAASGTRTIWLDTPFGRLPFRRSGDIEPKSGLGVSVWGGGEYQQPLADRLRLRLGADAWAREHKGRAFDRHSASAHVGPRWLATERTEASLLATVQRQWTAGRPESDEYGLRLEAEHRLTPRLALQSRTGLRRRDCRDCDWLDGPVGEVEVGASWAALPVLRVAGSAGYRWSNADEEEWRNAGHRVSFGATLDLPSGFTVGSRASIRRANYEGKGFVHRTIDRMPRRDRTRTLSVSVRNRGFTVFGYSPRLALILERHGTNAQALGYERERVELSFVRQF